MGRGVGVAAILGAVFFTLSCGGSSSTGQLRFVQASFGQPALNLLVDGKTQAFNLSYGNASAYLTVKTGSRHVQAVPTVPPNSTNAVFDTSVPISSSVNTTVLMTGQPSSVKPLVLTDGGTAPVTGDGYVRVINASLNMGAADVYLISAGSSLSSAKPVATSVGFDGNPGYHPIVAGDYELIMTSPGTLNVLLDSGPINLTTGTNWTVVVLDGAAPGTFSFSTMQDQ